jgi:hypothetical protein
MEVRRGFEGKGWNSLWWLPEERRVERVVKEGPVGGVYSESLRVSFWPFLGLVCLYYIAEGDFLKARGFVSFV